jgi:transcription termination factor Rho
MSVLDRSALADSSLADLHAIASELGIDGFRRLRRDPLIDSILVRQGGPEAEEAAPALTLDEALPGADADEDDDEERPTRSRRGGRGGRGGRESRSGGASRASGTSRASSTSRATSTASRQSAETTETETGEGVVELLPNGSAFLRLSPPEPSDEDVYVSAAQVRRCELVSGDVVAGPVRPPRRSERYPSLVRVETINGESAETVAQGARYEDLLSSFPADQLKLGGSDATLKAIDSLTPIGKGSRALIVGSARSGKTEALRRVTWALADLEGLDVSLVLAGIRPEEISEWREGAVELQSTIDFGASAETQAQAVERAIDSAKRVAARGGDAVVLIDTLEHLHPPAARRILSAARNLAESGSLTVIATAAKPFGGETTVIALDAQLAATGTYPALDLRESGTLRPELLVGDKGAAAIAKERAKA